MQNWWRDLACWLDAMSFILESFAYSSIEFDGTHFEFIPFRARKRICPRVTFGLTNIELTLAQQLYHFDWELQSRMTPKDQIWLKTLVRLSEGKTTWIWLPSLIILHSTLEDLRIMEIQNQKILSDGPEILHEDVNQWIP